MFLEVFETHRGEGDVSRQLQYVTSLSRETNNDSVVSWDVTGLNQLKEGYLGDISLAIEGGEIHVKRFYPFGEDIEKVNHRVYFDTREWRVELLGRGIAACIEVLLLGQFLQQDLSVHTDPLAGLSFLRLCQLQKYGIPQKTDIRSYLTLLAVHFPQHSILKFPSWINEGEILQLSEKA